MDKFSFKDVLVTVAGLFITVFIAWVLISATGTNPSEVAKYLDEGAFKGTRNIANTSNFNCCCHTYIIQGWNV